MYEERGNMSRPAIIERQSSIPPLENGDRLTRWEFERRYEKLFITADLSR